MKTTLTIALLLISNQAFSGEKYVCQEIDYDADQYKQRTVVLTQLNDKKIEENVAAPFMLELYEAVDVTPDLVVKGDVLTEDVMFAFESKDKSVRFQIYLDELDESTLTLKGIDSSYICR
jgi:hypothetical protein